MSNPGVNKNFVVQNGLTVGEMTIFAGNSDIRTSGNITVTGTGTINVPSIGVSSIAINDSSIAINDTGPTGSTIEFTLDGATAANISASGANLPAGAAYQINQTDVLSATTLKSGVINSSLTSVGTLQNLTVSGNTAINNTLYGRGVYDNSNRVVSTSSGAGNLTISGTGINLNSVGPGATTVGSSTSVPVITTDAYGRVVALTSQSVSTTINLAGTTGTGSVAGGGTLTFAGTYGVTAGASSSTITIATPQDLQTTASPTFAGLTASGVVKPNANASVTLGATNAYWNQFYAVGGNFNQATVGGSGLSSAGIVTITNNSDSTSAASGALQVTGGVGIGANLYVAGVSTLRGNVTIGGNLVVNGQSVSIGTSDLAIQDPIINLHTFANLQPLTSNDGQDIGIKVHYYDNADRAGFFGRTNTDGYFTYYAQGTDAANVFTGTQLGTIKGGTGIFSNTTTSTSTTTGALQVGGGAGIAGNVYSGGVGYFGSASSIALTNPVLVATGNYNSVAQVQVQNTNAGGSASGDIVISSDNGTDSTNFFNVGINSSGYNDAAFTVQKALDGYMYVNGGNLTVGTQSTGKNIVFHTGGTLAAQARVMISDIAITANGVSVLPSANVTQNLGSSTAFWGTTFTGQLTANAITVGGGGTTHNGSVVPGANVTYNLGSSTAYWGTTFTGQVTANTIVASAGTGNAAVFTGNVYHAGSIIPFTSNATYNLGTTNSWWGNFYGVSTQAKYADLAENYQADAIYEPGTVLMFGGEDEVTLADADTTAVAGVVSTNPAHLMNGALQGAKVAPIALQGRVPCKVIGPIAKGDILVSAGFGFAKTAPDRQLGMKFGQAIGKALENVAPGTKATIEVVVGRV